MATQMKEVGNFYEISMVLAPGNRSMRAQKGIMVEKGDISGIRKALLAQADAARRLMGVPVQKGGPVE